MGRKAVVIGLLAAVIITLTSEPHPLQADPPTPYRVVEPSEFAPIIVETFADQSHPPRPQVSTPTPPRREIARPQGQKSQTSVGSSIRGKASWYCKTGVSICHHAYPAGSMVAAACLKLRRAMGPNWRHKMVTVVGGTGSIKVELVDWCGSTTKLIDLYWEPMRRLGGTGTLDVKVSW